MVFSIFTVMQPLQFNFKTFFITPKRYLVSISSHSPYYPFQALVTTNLFSLCIYLFSIFPRTGIIRCGLLWLAFFFLLTITSSRFIDCIAFISTSFLLWNYISLYGNDNVCLSIHQLLDIWIAICFLASVKCCYEQLWTSFCVDIVSCLLGLRVELLECMVILFNILRNSKTVSKVTIMFSSLFIFKKYFIVAIFFLALLAIIIILFVSSNFTKYFLDPAPPSVLFLECPFS